MNEESPHNSDNFFENESDELADDMTSSLFSDFTHDDLVYEVMRLGLDPSNMGDKQMKALILEKLGLSRTNAKETKPNL